jgi:hypothetical protein
VTEGAANLLLVQPFPAPGQLVALAYRELDRAATGTPEQIRALGGDLRLLPRPWRAAARRSCGSSCGAGLKRLSSGWSPSVSRRLLTPFRRWPLHRTWCTRSPSWPISVGAPVMRSPVMPWRNGTAATCRASPKRMKSRLRNHCEDGHQTWLAKGRYTRHRPRSPTHPGEPFRGGHRCRETNRG